MTNKDFLDKPISEWPEDSPVTLSLDGELIVLEAMEMMNNGIEPSEIEPRLGIEPEVLMIMLTIQLLNQSHIPATKANISQALHEIGQILGLE